MKPQHASTVILIRHRGDHPSFEIFLVRRHHQQSFMGGAFVFPGGRLDDADGADDLLPFLDGFSAAHAREALQEPQLADHIALGLFVTAIRETFEEAGVLIACDSSGKRMDLAVPEMAQRFAAYRRALHEDRMTLSDLAQRESLCYAPGLLMPYSRWITPKAEPKRFDTRFFIVPVPPGQAAIHDERELTESCWIMPSSALERHDAGEITLMPPTLKTVEELSRFDDAERLMAVVRSRPIEAILPEVFIEPDEYGVLLPHDPAYGIAGYRRSPRPGEASRVVMRQGIWKLA